MFQQIYFEMRRNLKTTNDIYVEEVFGKDWVPSRRKVERIFCRRGAMKPKI